MNGNAKREGYVYQDILSAYIVAKNIYDGDFSSTFLFDVKKTKVGQSDKFDDISVFKKNESIFYQIKYSDEINNHILTKSDFTQTNKYDLALHTLYKSWKTLRNKTNHFRICLAWTHPNSNDEILQYINFIDGESYFLNSKCFKFDITKIWPNKEVVAKWKSLKSFVKKEKITRNSFADFLNDLVIEINLPKSSLLENFNGELDSCLFNLIKKDIGVGSYPNNQITPEECARKLCDFIRAKASKGQKQIISCNEILAHLHIRTDFGGINEEFPIDMSIITDTPERVSKIKDIIKTENRIIVEGNPGSGKSWFIENLEKEIKTEYRIIKHFCYTDLTDSLLKERITTNVFLGSLLAQLSKLNFVNFHGLANKYASNLDNLNKALASVREPLLIIVDGLDHIYRIFEQNISELCENEIHIIEAVSKLNLSNPLVKILLLSQPIKQLDILSNFYIVQLPKLDELYVRKLLPKYDVENFSLNNESLSQKIASKSNGNALFISYLIKEYKKNKVRNSFDWLFNIPDYDVELKEYYSFIYSKIKDSFNISMVLCCTDYSVTEKELKKITGLGDIVNDQIHILMPILQYTHAYGYSIYHESYKKFILERLQGKNVKIKDIVLPKLITWLENEDFYSNIKAYSFLLQYYNENKDYTKIEQYISQDFLYQSLSGLFPIHTIKQNHKWLLQSAKYINKLCNEIILIQQSLAINIFDELDDNTIGSLLLASTSNKNEDAIINFLYPNERLAFDFSKTFRILRYLCMHGVQNVNWNILSEHESELSLKDVGCLLTMLLDRKDYNKVNSLVSNWLNLQELQENADFWLDLFDNFEWYYLTKDESITSFCPAVLKAYHHFFFPTKTFHDFLSEIVQKDFIGDKISAVSFFVRLFWAARVTSEKKIEEEIQQITERNWFLNWIIYSIKIIKISQRNFSYEELVSAFSLLCADLDQYKGKIRACDLYAIENLIHKTFYLGLNLGKKDLSILKKCILILEKVTETQTSFFNYPGGPLTTLKYSEIKATYCPDDPIKNQTITNIYKENGYYHLCASQFFLFSYLFSKQKNAETAEKYYDEGIKSLLTIGTHKDYSLSDLICLSDEYHKSVKNLPKKFFYKLENLSYLMQSHTDRDDVANYPDEWFSVFLDAYPEDAIKYLIHRTINNEHVYGYHEYALKIFMERNCAVQYSTLWFLLWLSLPLLKSEKSIFTAFKLRNHIDKRLLPFFDQWMKNRPTISLQKEQDDYSNDIIRNYKDLYKIDLSHEEKNDFVRNNDFEISLPSKTILAFKASSFNEALGYFEKLKYDQELDLQNIQTYILSLDDCEKKKILILEISKKLAYKDIGKISILFDSSSDEYIYFNIALFVYTNRGGFEVLTNCNYFDAAYKKNKEKSLSFLQEILAIYIIDNSSSYKLSSNLVCSLIKLKRPEKEIQPLFDIVDKFITKRFPDALDDVFQESSYSKLDDFSFEELLVALLIGRLKTLTGEKNRNILLGIKFISETNPELLIKPYCFFFSSFNLLLPSQRAVLLQILHENVPNNILTKELLDILEKNYPTQFFIEDHYIRKICKLQNLLLPCIPNRLIYPSHVNDENFLSLINERYKFITDKYGCIHGSYNEYQKYRKDFSEKYKDIYVMQLEKICAPIINYPDIAYQIVNQRLYEVMDYSEKNDTLIPSEVRFTIEDTVQNITSLSERPAFLPFPIDMDDKPEGIRIFSNNEWVIICANETQYISKENFEKKAVYGKIILVADKQYKQPIVENCNFEEIDKKNYFLLSDILVNILNLTLNKDIFTGFFYLRNQEIVAKSISWREKYMGSIENGLEIPTYEGNALLVKKNLLDEIKKIYQGNLILLKKVNH